MKKQIIFKNTFFGLTSQIISMIFLFVSRKVFLDYIGVELLGLSNTFLSILQTLSLAELGFQNAIVYSLYKPLNENNWENINKIMSIFKRIYTYVGVFILVASTISMVFIPKIITGIEIAPYVYIIFMIQVATASMTYFLAYKRTLLYADQKEYINKLIDLVFNVVFNILQIVGMIYTKNIYLYLVLKLIQTFGSNIIVHIMCSRLYPLLENVEIDKEWFVTIRDNVKEIFLGRVAGYIYSSTDNLVISIFISTVTVGFMSNYMTIIQGVKALVESILRPIIPMIGRSINSEEGKKREYETFNMYTHVRFLIACMIVIPMFLLINDVIIMWIGDEFLIAKIIPALLSIELYIYLVHGSCPAFINGNGLFKIAKYIDMIGAVCNIATSIILVQIIGLPGVLIGTVFSQIIFWLGRSYIVFRFIFRDMKIYLKYWGKQLYYLLVFTIGLGVCSLLQGQIQISDLFLKFILLGMMYELIIVVLIVATLSSMGEQKVLNTFLVNLIKKGRG